MALAKLAETTAASQMRAAAGPVKLVAMAAIHKMQTEAKADKRLAPTVKTDKTQRVSYLRVVVAAGAGPTAASGPVLRQPA